MAYIPANNTLQVELRATQFGKEIENVLYFQRLDTIEAAEVTALENWLETVFIPALRSQQATTYAYDEIYSTDLTTGTSPTYTRVISPPILGTIASPGLPNSNACCISFRTPGRGRSARGRNFVGGLTETQVTNDGVNLSEINGLVAKYELLLGGGTFPAGWKWVIVSKFIDNLPRIIALVLNVVDVLSSTIDIDSQRKRVK